MARKPISLGGGGGGSGTVSGTSGYIPKFSSGSAVGNSACDDGVTTASTITCTEPIAIAGSTAGYVDLPQGTSNSTGTTSARIQAPTSVTSYIVNVPASAPSNNNSAIVFTNASPAVGSFLKMPQLAITSGSAYTNGSGSFTNVVGSAGQTLQFSVEASTNYVVNCQIVWSASANTCGPSFQWTGPASPTAVAATHESAVTTSTTFTPAAATAFSSAMANTGTVSTATNLPAQVTLGLVNGSNAGTVTLQAKCNGAGTLTIQPGSYCWAQ
jgi:hypothetical protein